MGQGCFLGWGAREGSVSGVPGPGEGKRLESRKLKQKVILGELACYWSGKLEPSLEESIGSSGTQVSFTS